MRYTLHGLEIRSNAEIPGLCPIEDSPVRRVDLTIWLGVFPSAAADAVAATWFESRYTTDTGEPMLRALRLAHGDQYRITYCDGTDFVIDGAGREVWVTWPSSMTVGEVSAYLLGPIVGVVMRLRGMTCLHASAVNVDGRAVAFLGREGAGKSTTAAALAVKGFPVLSDDTIALTEARDEWTAAPGYPRVRLWPDAAGAIRAEAGTPALIPPGATGSASRYHLNLQALRSRFQSDPLTLGLVYFLDEPNRQNQMSAEALTPSQALLALVPNTYATRVLDRDMRAREFEALSRFVERVPVRRLTRPADLATLSDFCDFVVEDLRAMGFARQAAEAVH
jgi:hypothetical protein